MERARRSTLLTRARRMLFAGLAAVTLTVTLILALQEAWVDPDTAAIRRERSRRLGEARQHVTLTGTPDLAHLDERLEAQGLKLGSAAFIRIFKREFELELWLKNGQRYELFATYPICLWSGRLGPKISEGDMQSPEGFYTIDARALNPHSRHYRAFNLGFPNAFDRSLGRTGSFLMVHGGCSSVGCFAMTDPVIGELWQIVSAALKRGQKDVHVHVFPFRMKEEALAQRKDNRWADFWQQIKAGYDAFEATRVPPGISVCQGRYQVAAASVDRSNARRLECAQEVASP
jgi:murein L,D-transpeptidase YafK